MATAAASRRLNVQGPRGDVANGSGDRGLRTRRDPTDALAGSLLAATIYVVDDEPANTLLLERFLQRAGFTAVETFTDPRAALARIEAEEPDVLLLDLHMPAIDGFAILGALQERVDANAFLPILMLTGDLDRSIRSRALSNGASDFLTKPFDGEEVVLRVRNFARTRKLHQQLLARNAVLGSEVAEATRALADAAATWQSVTGSLARLPVVETAEAAAAAVCAELAAVPDVAGVALLAFASGGRVIPIGLHMPTTVPMTVNVALPDSLATALRRRTADGPWVESWSAPSSGSPLQPHMASAGFRAGAFVPMRSGSVVRGLLIAAATGPRAAARLTPQLPALEMFAAVTSTLLAPGIEHQGRKDAVRDQVQATLSERAFVPVFQPIVKLESGAVVGYEALTRFRDGTPPDQRFADAQAVGLGLELETATLAEAVRVASPVPDHLLISLNASPGLLLDDGHLPRILERVSRPIVVEITEHAQIDDYPEFRGALDRLGPSVRFAVDDAGAGYSSFHHIVELRPDFVKIDIGLVRDIDQDPVREAFVACLVHFTRQTGTTLIAEGIETAAELGVLRGLGVHLGQGYYLGRPAPIDALLHGAEAVALV